MAEDFEARQQALYARLGQFRKAKSRLEAKMHKVETQIIRLAEEREDGRIKAILDAELPGELATARLKVLKLQEEAAQEDITVARQRELRTELLPGAISGLQRLCDHRIVSFLKGHSGAIVDEPTPDWRKCSVCGLEDWGEPKVLTPRSDRYFSQDYEGDPRHQKVLLPWSVLTGYCRMSSSGMYDLITNLRSQKK